MRQIRIVFLLFTIILCSASKWRCYIACDDQTAVQNDYSANRDECRDLAEKKLESEMAKTENPTSSKARQAKLVTLFADCMAEYGWDVPTGAEKPKQVADNKGDIHIYVQTAEKRATTPAQVAVAETKEIKPLVATKPEKCKVPAENAKKLKKSQKKVSRSKCDSYDVQSAEPATQPKIKKSKTTVNKTTTNNTTNNTTVNKTTVNNTKNVKSESKTENKVEHKADIKEEPKTTKPVEDANKANMEKSPPPLPSPALASPIIAPKPSTSSPSPAVDLLDSQLQGSR